MASPIWHTRRGFLRTLTLGAGAAAVSGCVTNASPVVTEIPEYRLGAGDELRVIVFGEAELTGQYEVGTRGTIAYPLLGDIEAAGLTPPEFAARLQEGLTQYLRSPNVSVEVANYRPFFILGEVRNAGQFPYVSGMTVETAIAIAGGYTERASERKFRITRRVNGAIDEITAGAGAKQAMQPCTCETPGVW